MCSVPKVPTTLASRVVVASTMWLMWLTTRVTVLLPESTPAQVDRKRAVRARRDRVDVVDRAHHVRTVEFAVDVADEI